MHRLAARSLAACAGAVLLAAAPAAVAAEGKANGRDALRVCQDPNNLPFANIQRVEFDPADEATIHVTTFGGSVWRGPATPTEP